LADGRAYLMGDAPSLPDFSAWVTFSSAPRLPPLAVNWATMAALQRWHDCMSAFDRPTADQLSPDEAIAIAAASVPATQPGIAPNDPNDLHVGDLLAIHQSAYCWEPVVGEVVSADTWSIALRRHDPRAGEVIVHFPREGTTIIPTL
jgi:hypothetical protein